MNSDRRAFLSRQESLDSQWSCDIPVATTSLLVERMLAQTPRAVQRVLKNAYLEMLRNLPEVEEGE